MDSKSPLPPFSNEEDPPSPPPPTYTESLTTINSPPSNDTKSTPSTSTSSNTPQNHYTTQIQRQLSTLTTTITTMQTQKSLLTSALDTKILSLLTPPIQSYLSDFATSDATRGTLILAPRAGLKDEKAKPPEFGERRERFERLVRIGSVGRVSATIGSGSGSGSGGADVDVDGGVAEYERRREEYGYGYEEEEGGESGELLFWRDEVMATRLASYLRPTPKEVKPRPRRVPQVLPPREEPAKPSSSFVGSLWGRKKQVAPPPPPPPPVVEDQQRFVVEPEEDRVIMEVKGEEVYFSTENEFGLLGSKTGYCIVINLRVVLARR